MLPTVLGFPKGKRVTDHYSILAPEAVGFELKERTEQMAKLRSIGL